MLVLDVNPFQSFTERSLAWVSVHDLEPPRLVALAEGIHDRAIGELTQRQPRDGRQRVFVLEGNARAAPTSARNRSASSARFLATRFATRACSSSMEKGFVR